MSHDFPECNFTSPNELAGKKSSHHSSSLERSSQASPSTARLVLIAFGSPLIAAEKGGLPSCTASLVSSPVASLVASFPSQAFAPHPTAAATTP
eukprot:CAMPEP_0184533072 /NCGR_PEP_ID=MMETSP0198_2-20121128/14539_1 /TAXON_ID=1112570 /ORGANISM="Thraustochytrium sp., Strain LLF1b" /LENGTH=93 /DNA_ID=CAMNT_0026925779 /DNA_START=100 /DNA_END=378 /DNA_ORIENTATION=+